MSDQPDTDPPTFWWKCPSGHVEERPMPSVGFPPLRCDARTVKVHEGGSGIYQDVCGEELRHVGPTVAEWRATNDALVEAKDEGRRQVEHRERLLQEADRALAECSAQLDRALANEGSLGAQLGAAEREVVLAYAAHTTRAREAEAEVLRLREELENATAAAWLNRDAAAREAVARRHQETAERDRDAARADRADQYGRVERLRRFLDREAERADDRGRHGLARRLRRAKSESWTTAEMLDQERALARELGACLPVELSAPRGGIRYATPGVTEPLTLDAQAHRIAELEGALAAHRRASSDAADLERQVEEWRVKAMTEQQGRLEAERHVQHHHERGGPFTIVRDVNQQTEAALKRSERERRAQCTLTAEAQDVARWAHSQATGECQSYAEARRAYEASIDADADE